MSNLNETQQAIFFFRSMLHLLGLLASYHNWHMDGQTGAPIFNVDFTREYAKRRPDEARSHYSQRLKFINELIKHNPDMSDERIDVISSCYSNVKLLNNIYHKDIMDIIIRHDPDVKASLTVSTTARNNIAHIETAK